MMDAPEATDWDLRPMWRWRHQSSYPTWSSRTLPRPHHEVKSNSPFPLILHRACDSPGTNRMRQKRCSVTPENSPWEEMQLLPCELEHTFGALHHYMRSLRLLCREEAQVPPRGHVLLFRARWGPHRQQYQLPDMWMKTPPDGSCCWPPGHRSLCAFLSEAAQRGAEVSISCCACSESLTHGICE